MNYKLKTTSDVEDVQQPIWTAFVKIAKLLGFEKKYHYFADCDFGEFWHDIAWPIGRWLYH